MGTGGKVRRESRTDSDDPKKTGSAKRDVAGSGRQATATRNRRQRAPRRITAINRLKKGYASALSGKYQDAIDSYDRSITLNPAFAEADFVWGVAYYQMGDPKRALRELDKAIDPEAMYAGVYYSRGAGLQQICPGRQGNRGL